MSSLATPDGKASFRVNAVDALVISNDPFATNQDSNLTIAESTPLCSDGFHE